MGTKCTQLVDESSSFFRPSSSFLVGVGSCAPSLLLFLLSLVSNMNISLPYELAKNCLPYLVERFYPWRERRNSGPGR